MRALLFLLLGLTGTLYAFNPSYNLENAKELKPGEYFGAELKGKKNKHWYALYVKEGTVIQASIKFDKENSKKKSDLDLYLYNDQEKTIARSNTSKRNFESITKGDLKGGIYFLKVKSNTKESMSYSIKYEVTGNTETCGFDQMPAEWADMEIESKWEGTKEQYDALAAALTNGAKKFGYDMEVRWDGIPRRFVDIYFDTEDQQLVNSGHALRYRTQYSTDAKRGDDLVGLYAAKNYSANWTRLQYKSTPERVGEVWFRQEKGDCRVWLPENDNADDKCKIKEKDIFKDNNFSALNLSKEAKKHDAITRLLSDHPKINLKGLKAFSAVEDFRYRVVFKEKDVVVFEMSMDRLRTTKLANHEVSDSYEIEFEILKEGYGTRELHMLFELSKKLRKEFNLSPSENSKGGNFIKARCN